MIHESLQWRQVHHVTVVQTLSFGIFFFFFYKNFALIVCIRSSTSSEINSGTIGGSFGKMILSTNQSTNPEHKAKLNQEIYSEPKLAMTYY